MVKGLSIFLVIYQIKLVQSTNPLVVLKVFRCSGMLQSDKKIEEIDMIIIF